MGTDERISLCKPSVPSVKSVVNAFPIRVIRIFAEVSEGWTKIQSSLTQSRKAAKKCTETLLPFAALRDSKMVFGTPSQGWSWASQ